jgi:pilus assembly protein FimV
MAIMKRGVALAIMLGMSAVHAAGLGKLTVNSALGQPLNAEIDLVSVQAGEVDSLQARVATPEAFRDARIEYSPSVRLLRFAVDKRANGQPYLKVTSVAPINEPFVDVLIEVTWPAGRLQREYPILLDPPGYAQAQVAAPTVAAAPPARAPESTPPAQAPASSSTAPVAPPKAAEVPAGTPSARAEMAAQGRGAPREAAAGAASGSDTYGPVQKGDTLNKIAESVKPSSVSLEQMLVALYRENKSAFVSNNMNRLKAGQILKVPAAEDIEKIDTKEANREYRTHVSDWKAYREQLAGGVAATPAKPESANAASGRVTSAAVTPPPTSAPASGDVLKLSKTEGGKAAGAGAGGGAAANQERLNALQEEVTAKNKALQESQSRVAELEKQIRDMQRLMELKGGAPGKDSKVAVVPPAPTKPAEAPKAETKLAEAPKPVEATKPAEAPKAAEAPKPAETKPADASKTTTTTTTESSKTTTTTPAEAPKAAESGKPSEPPKPENVAEAPKKPAPKKVVAPPPAPGFMDEITDNPLMLGGIGAAILLAGAGAFLFMRRRRAEAEEPTPSQMTSSFPSDLKPTTGTGPKPAAGLVDTGNSSFLTDFDKTGPGTIDTDEVDPVAEAEVYIAYGRDAQAEEILKEAMARDRNRHEIPLKLLEIYHARKSATAFETVAKELRASVGESSPLWQKAAAMGAQIDPNNPLYGAAAAGAATYTAMAPAAPAPKPDLDFDLEGSHQQSQSREPPAFDLDLGTDKPARHAHETAPQASSSGLDFNIEQSIAPKHMDMPAEASKDEKPAFDFDLSGLELPGSGKKSPDLDLGSPASHEKAPSLDLADLSLDSSAAADGGGGGEGVGTKLELAKAYLEIGDKDGAREILQEVAKEGSSAQRAEAQKLIATL